MAASIAIVGSGPSGLYCAERLARDLPDARVDVIERWPAPFGLVRAGVAADHQVTKAVTRVLERPLSVGKAGFIGNVTLGRDVSLDELRSLYDAVILATGAEADRCLGIPGEALAGVIGSGAFVGWLNGRPGVRDLAADVARARSVVLIGNGNVALDLVRLLAKVPGELAGSDLDPEVASVLAAAPLREIHVIGRRGPHEARFTPVELEELGRLSRAGIDVHTPDLPVDPSADTPVLKILRGFDARVDAELRIHFHFNMEPAGLTGGTRVEDIHLRARNGTETRLGADLVVTCIGYEVGDGAGLPIDGGCIANADGRVAQGLYTVGWAKRGPSGTIATNRAEAHLVAKLVAEELSDGNRQGTDGLTALLRARGVDIVSWQRWKAIDAAEIAAAPEGRVRLKFRDAAAMLNAAAT